ncbi:MAG: AraC family transcriptional regulator [Gemmatimonadaceae bacterium]
MSSLVANGTYFGQALRVRHNAGLSLAETQYGPHMVVPQHEHETALCVLVLEGAFEEHSERQRDYCAPGTLLFLPEGASHAHRFLAPRSRAFTVQFGSEWTRRLDACDVRMPAFGQIQRRGQGSWNAALLYREFRSNDGSLPLALDEGAVSTLDALRRASATETNARRARWLNLAREYVSAHFRETFSLAELAQLAGVHPAYLSRAFRRHTGETLSALVRRLRLEHAAERLAASDAAIGHIGLDVGFADHSHFTREFKRATGTTPQAYRQLFSPPRAKLGLPSAL